MQRAYCAYLQTNHLGSLDGLRCLSILGVIRSHTGAMAFPDSALLSRGWLGVLATTLAAGLSFRYYGRFFLNLKGRFSGDLRGIARSPLGSREDLVPEFHPVPVQAGEPS